MDMYAAVKECLARLDALEVTFRAMRDASEQEVEQEDAPDVGGSNAAVEGEDAPIRPGDLAAVEAHAEVHDGPFGEKVHVFPAGAVVGVAEGDDAAGFAAAETPEGLNELQGAKNELQSTVLDTLSVAAKPEKPAKAKRVRKK